MAKPKAAPPKKLTPKQERFVAEYLIDADRFWGYVDRSAGPDECWPWMAAVDRGGYGRFHTGTSRNSSMLAHRVAFGLTHGDLPPVVRHRCDNPPCCNPAHHQDGTRADNNRDISERGRHAAQLGTMNAARGERHGSAKLAVDQVAEIRSSYDQGGITQRELAVRFKVSQRTINKIVRKLGWIEK